MSRRRYRILLLVAFLACGLLAGCRGHSPVVPCAHPAAYVPTQWTPWDAHPVSRDCPPVISPVIFGPDEGPSSERTPPEINPAAPYPEIGRPDDGSSAQSEFPATARRLPPVVPTSRAL